MNDIHVINEIKSLEKSIFNELIRNQVKKERNVDRFAVLTPTQIEIIHCLLKSKEGFLYQKDLENKLNLKRATVSGVLKTMEKNELIKRKISNDDTRLKKIYLNESAKRVFEENKLRILNLEDNIIKGISKEELNVFLSVISKMKENVKKERMIKC